MSSPMKQQTIKHLQEYIQSKKDMTLNQMNKLGNNLNGSMKPNGVGTDQG